ncbi:2-deoxyglucose-6-phosphatase [Persicitalea jodogahamensis]|uniref:2-deoxyglucose-6-phosphatase n=2 Tax=Persicitalea jodogahamensis TaxID=402147 RepID=A0A8J3G7W1_9BACT|nr:2-deoxyglucose-6-phosphatase [Persicitalea jodogahamensis]
MDGLLVDSEPIWRQVAIEVFDTVGVALTEDFCRSTTGLGTVPFVQLAFDTFPWEGKSQTQIGDEIILMAHERIGANAHAMPGALELIQFFYERGIPLAVASASPMEIIETVLERLDIKQYFRLWHSALLEARNKPFPDVYLGAARMLGVEPSRCLAFEDSGNGLRSAVSAGMKTIAVPADYEYDDSKFDVATLKIPSLLSFDEGIFDTLSKTTP